MKQRWLVLSAFAALAGCAVGPDYERPSAPVPASYKEAPIDAAGATWLPAAPADTLARGDWWRLFGDAELDRLAGAVDAANQTIAAAVVSYTQAQSLVREARAGYYPTVGLDASGRRFGGGNGSAGSTTGTANAFAASLNGDWAPDFWGRVSRSVESARAGEQGSAADLASARLSAQGALAIDYFSLRESDSEIELLTRSIEGYERALQITQNRYDAGIAPKTDVLQAQTQVATTRARRPSRPLG
jgi:outer membrane protein TolC